MLSYVRVRALPSHAPVSMSRAAALHLFQLVQRYNWCLSGADYRARWSGFWPRVASVERLLLVLCIRANCAGVFGSRIAMVESPVDFEVHDGGNEPLPLTAEVAVEFRALLELHYGRLGSPDDLYAWLSRECPKEFDLVLSISAQQRVFGHARWFDVDLVKAKCRQSLQRYGWDYNVATAIAITLARSMVAFQRLQERQL